MIPVKSETFVDTSSPMPTSTFGIRIEDFKHLIPLLQDDVYSDKILAPIREYSCNALDAHVMANKGSLPIDVDLPSKLTPEFTVRDYGYGLTHDELLDVFINYGRSTKRDSNDTIGQLGIGSKSGFAYGDNFLITSFKNGIESAYNAVKGPDGANQLISLYSVDSNAPSGLKITIPVKSADIEIFRSKAINFFKYWEIKPNMRIGEHEKTKYEFKNVFLETPKFKLMTGNTYMATPLAVMGNIAYSINKNQINTALGSYPDDSALASILLNGSIVLYFDIGELKMAPSREELQYTNAVNTAIIMRLREMGDAVISHIKNYIAASESIFDAKLRYKRITCDSTLNDILTYINKWIPSLYYKEILIKDSYLEVYGNKLGIVGDPEKKQFLIPNDIYTFTKNKLVKRKDNMLPCDAEYLYFLVDQPTKVWHNKCIKTFFRNKNVRNGGIYMFKYEDTSHAQELSSELNTYGVPYIRLSDITEDYIKNLPKKEKVVRNKSIVRSKEINPDFESDGCYITKCYNSIDLSLGGYYIPETSPYGGLYKAKKICDLHSIPNLLPDMPTIVLLNEKTLSSKKFLKYKPKWIDYLDKINTYIASIDFTPYLKMEAFNFVTQSTSTPVSMSRAVMNTIVSLNPRIKSCEILQKLFDILPEKNIGENVKKLIDSGITLHSHADYNKHVETISETFTELNAKYPMLSLHNSTLTSTVPNLNHISKIANYIVTIQEHTQYKKQLTNPQ